MMRILRAAPTLLRIGLADAFAYRAEFLVWVLTTTLPLIMLALWSAAVQAGGPLGRFRPGGFAPGFLGAFVRPQEVRRRGVGGGREGKPPGLLPHAPGGPRGPPDHPHA